MSRAEDWIDLTHFPKHISGNILAKGHWYSADLQVERNVLNRVITPLGFFALRHQAVAQNHGGAKRGMACERNFLLGNKNAHFHAVLFFDRWIARENKGGFLKIGFAREVLHLRVAQTARISKDSKSVALEAVSGENINLDDVKAAAALLRNRLAGMGGSFCEGRGQARSADLQEGATRGSHGRGLLCRALCHRFCVPPGLVYRIFWPRPERTSSTPRSAVRLCSSRMGLISTTSRETMDSVSAIISIARWASR